MLRVARWVALLSVLSILAVVAVDLVAFAETMKRFGGIPWSADLIQLNLGWVIATAVGMALIVLSGCGFAWARRRRD